MPIADDASFASDCAISASRRRARLAAHLPPDISFLALHGISEADLTACAEEARRIGVSAAQAALAFGLVADDVYYAALAWELDLPFITEGVKVAHLAEPGACLRAGLAPLAERGDGLRYLHAPTGGQIGALIDRPIARHAGLALTTPRRLADAVRQANGTRIAHEAANGLADAQPALSARTGLSRRAAVLWCLVLAALGLLAFVAPRQTALGLTALLSLPFFGLTMLRLAAMREDIPVSEAPSAAFLLPDDALPVYTVLVPLYREVGVLPQLTRALRALDYPAAKLDVKILLEEEDRATIAALRAANLPPYVSLLIAPNGQPRTKPRALNIGLAEARGELLVVYDAEDVPDPLQLRRAACAFAVQAPDIACLQARLAIDNTADSWLTRMFTIEYSQLFDVINPGLARLDLPVPLGGTSNHFQVSVLRQLRGWDAWNVTEDADLGLRLSLAGYRVADLPSTTFEEAPAALRAWIVQRTRWMKGWMQVALVHGRQPLVSMRAMGAVRFLSAMALVMGTVATALGFPIFTALALYAFAATDWLADIKAAPFGLSFAVTLFAAGLISLVLPAFEGLRRRGLPGLTRDAVTLPLYYILMSLAAWRAFAQMFYAPSKWEKTEHGKARTSRTGAITIR